MEVVPTYFKSIYTALTDPVYGDIRAFAWEEKNNYKMWILYRLNILNGREMNIVSKYVNINQFV